MLTTKVTMSWYNVKILYNVPCSKILNWSTLFHPYVNHVPWVLGQDKFLYNADANYKVLWLHWRNLDVMF